MPLDKLEAPNIHGAVLFAGVFPSCVQRNAFAAVEQIRKRNHIAPFSRRGSVDGIPAMEIHALFLGNGHFFNHNRRNAVNGASALGVENVTYFGQLCFVEALCIIGPIGVKRQIIILYVLVGHFKFKIVKKHDFSRFPIFGSQRVGAVLFAKLRHGSVENDFFKHIAACKRRVADIFQR